MNSIKLLTAVMAVLLSLVTVFAFTDKTDRNFDPVWYLYNGTGDIDEPTSYTKDGAEVPSVCDGVNALCAIKLPDNGSNPSQSDLDPAFVAHIESVMSSQTPDDQTVRLRE